MRDIMKTITEALARLRAVEPALYQAVAVAETDQAPLIAAITELYAIYDLIRTTLARLKRQSTPSMFFVIELQSALEGANRNLGDAIAVARAEDVTIDEVLALVKVAKGWLIQAVESDAGRKEGTHGQAQG